MDEYCITCRKASEPPRGNTIDWFPVTHTTDHHPQQCRLCSHSRRTQPARPREPSCMHHVTENPSLIVQTTNHRSATTPLPRVQRKSRPCKGSLRRHEINPASQSNSGARAGASTQLVQRSKRKPKTAAKTLVPLTEGKKRQQYVSALVSRVTTVVFVYLGRLTNCKKGQKK